MADEVPPVYHFSAWLELPYFVGVSWVETFQAIYRPGISIDLRLSFRTDLLRVDIRNFWSAPPSWEELAKVRDAGGRIQLKWAPRYVQASEVPDLKARVEQDEWPYLHIDRPETVVEVRGDFTPQMAAVMEVRKGLGLVAELLPRTSFFNSEILPRVGAAVDAFRIAALPAMRFATHPVSEALVDTAFIEIADERGEVIQQLYYGFDVRGRNREMQAHAKDFGVQARFEAALAQPDAVEPENQFASCYNLFHMRRWADALVVASAVVDRLLRDAVFGRLDNDVAELIWASYRNRTVDVLKQVFPAVGLGSLPANGDLWRRFGAAKTYRGSVAHGKMTRPFDDDEQALVRAHLLAFYDAARWICGAMGRTWALDFPEDKGVWPL